MIPAQIQSALGTWRWVLRPTHFVVRQGDEIIEEAEAIGPTATVDPTPMIEGSWWGENPWFVDRALSASQLQYLSEAGFPPARARVAADALRRLFPLSACQTLAREHDTRMLIAPLYQTFVPFVTPLLALGCDLAEALLWDDQHLLKRLSIPAEHWSAATEIAVGAALRRAGLRVDREPRGRDEKRPEYVVYMDSWRYFIEVKTNPSSLVETRADELERGVMWFHGEFSDVGRKVVVTGSEKLHRLLSNSTAGVPSSLGGQLRSDLRRYLETTKALGDYRPGHHRVGDYLSLEIGESGDNTGTLVSLSPEISDEKAAYRIIRKVREAATQIPRAGSGVAVVEIGAARNLVVLHQALHIAFASTPAAFEPIRALVFHVGVPTESGHRIRRTFGGAAPGCRLDTAEQGVLRALLMPRLEGGEVIRETVYGDGGSKLYEFTTESKADSVSSRS